VPVNKEPEFRRVQKTAREETQEARVGWGSLARQNRSSQEIKAKNVREPKKRGLQDASKKRSATVQKGIKGGTRKVSGSSERLTYTSGNQDNTSTGPLPSSGQNSNGSEDKQGQESLLNFGKADLSQESETHTEKPEKRSAEKTNETVPNQKVNFDAGLKGGEKIVAAALYAEEGLEKNCDTKMNDTGVSHKGTLEKNVDGSHKCGSTSWLHHISTGKYRVLFTLYCRYSVPVVPVVSSKYCTLGITSG